MTRRPPHRPRVGDNSGGNLRRTVQLSTVKVECNILRFIIYTIISSELDFSDP